MVHKNRCVLTYTLHIHHVSEIPREAPADRGISETLHPIPHEINALDWKSEPSSDSKRLAEHLSAFANLAGGGFLVFGMTPFGEMKGLAQEEIKRAVASLGNIARDGLQPSCQIDHVIMEYPGLSAGVALLIVHIPETSQKPVHIRGKSIEFSFIRSGGQTRKMDESEIRRAMLSSRPQRFEELPLATSDPEAIARTLDIVPVCERLKKPYPDDPQKRLELLADLGFVVRAAGKAVPTYLGVLIACRDLNAVPGCERFGIQVTQFRGSSKLSAQKELYYQEGYVHCFDRMIGDIMALLPHSEVLERATRKTVPVYPELALRELIANAVVHRDYSRTDSRVQVEIFDDRIEITNPGSLLPEMEVNRLIDQQPRARNEVLTSFMRNLGFCEERGSGIDRAALQMELYGLPALEFVDYPDSFRAIIYAPKVFRQMSQAERIRTAYQHTCLHYVMRKVVTNASLRERLKLNPNQSQLVSKLIRQTIEATLIKTANPGASPRYIRYVPYWA